MNAARLTKRLLRAVFLLVLLALLAFAGLIFYIITGPRSLNQFTPYIESAIAPPAGAYRVHIARSDLEWDGWRHPVSIHIKDVTVSDAHQETVARFPEIELRMYLLELLIGKLNVKSMEILRPSLVLAQQADGSLSFGFAGTKTAEEPEPLADVLGLISDTSGENPASRLQSLLIRHAGIVMKNPQGETLLATPDATLEVRRERGSTRGTLSMPVRFGKHTSEIDLDVALDHKDKSVKGGAVYTDIPSAVIAMLFPQQEWLKSVDLSVSGWVSLITDFDARVTSLDFMLDSGQGSIAYPSEFDAPLEPHHLHVAGSFSDHLHVLTVKECGIAFKEFALNFTGVVQKSTDYALDGIVETKNVTLDALNRYWPKSLSPHTRQWMRERVSGGLLTSGKAELHFKPGDFALKDPPDAAIKAHVAVKGASVRYMPKHPPIEQLDGEIDFTGNTMDARATHAHYMTGTEISRGRIRLPDLAAPDVRLFLDMDLTSPARDVAAFLALPDVNKAEKLNLTEAIKGMAQGNAKLDFIAFSENDKHAGTGHIHYAIKANLTNAAQPAFMHQNDVADANVRLGVTNAGVTVNGRARINRLPMNIDLASQFGGAHETRYAIKTAMPVDKLPDFGLPKMRMLTGEMGVDASFISSDDEDAAHASLDLTRTGIDLPDHAFLKAQGKPAFLTLDTKTLASGNTAFPHFEFHGGDMQAEGSTEISKGSGDFLFLDFTRLHINRNNLQTLRYDALPDGVKVRARGHSLDISPYLYKKSSGSGKDALVLDIKVDEVILGDNRTLKDVSAETDCHAHCAFAHVESKLNDGTPFHYTIDDGVLNASCADAGELLRVFNVFSGIKGGLLTLDGVYRNGATEGALRITDFALSHAPMMTKVFTIASLTGLVDTVRGKGIAFSKLIAPYRFRHNVIIVKDAKTHGSALGVTADGTIDIDEKKLDLDGVLVPSYTLNSLIGNVPLIGNLLIGGSGKGLIALNYRIHGEMADPAISVNPLSVFTPGFLRGVFDIFDKPAPDFDTIEAKRKGESKKEEEKRDAEPASNAQKPASADPLSPSAP